MNYISEAKLQELRTLVSKSLWKINKRQISYEEFGAIINPLTHCYDRLMERAAFDERQMPGLLHIYWNNIRLGTDSATILEHTDGSTYAFVWDQYRGFFTFVVRDLPNAGLTPITYFDMDMKSTDRIKTFRELLLALPKFKGKGSRAKNKWIKEQIELKQQQGEHKLKS